MITAPSLLSADFSDVSTGLKAIETSGADWIHLDIMDGHFVPAISFGDKMVADVRKKTTLPLDVHLMTLEPERYIDTFAAAGAYALTFHLEAAVHCHSVVQKIKKHGLKAGISIVPSTPVAMLDFMLPFIDLILIMTVNPGQGGQTIISECFDKVKALVERRQTRHLSYLVSVDGGINLATAASAKKAGADILVAGSAFFNAEDKSSFIRQLRQ